MADRLKILIVEDDKNVQALYNLGLPEEEFEKRFSSDGRDALESYYFWHPDIILLDIMLPTVSGYSILKTIREGAQDEETTIIMSTSMAGRHDVLDCLKLGIQGYIVKPFKHREIKDKVLEYYNRARSDRAAVASPAQTN